MRMVSPDFPDAPRPFRLRFLLNPRYVANRLRSLRSPRDLASRVRLLAVYARDSFLIPPVTAAREKAGELRQEALWRLYLLGLRFRGLGRRRIEGPTPRLYCSKPFECLEVHEEGRAYLCCPRWLPVAAGELATAGVREIWNGARAREIRRSILDGSFRYCDREACPWLAGRSGPVSRLEDVRSPALRLAIRKNSDRLPRGPREINAAFDRSCNLSCPSCRSSVIVETGKRERLRALRETIEREALPDADLLYITGSGDPFGSPFFREWLRGLNRDRAGGLKAVRLHSNGLLWTREAWEGLPVSVRALIASAEISIDAATPETYAENRRGGSFERLLENLRFIGGLRRSGALRSLDFSMVVQENNFAQMPDFARLGRRFGADRVFFGRLENWGTFSAAEYSRRAVHRPEHPRNRELRNVLAEPILAEPFVRLGNLAGLPAAAAAVAAFAAVARMSDTPP